MDGPAFKEEGNGRWRRWAQPVACFLFACACSGGCQRNCQFVEMALRARECELRETREQLHQSRLLNEALLQELQTFKQAPVAAASGDKSSPTIKDIVIGRQSGGVDDDPTPGDEALQVVVEPRDLNGKVVRAAGTVEIIATEIGPKGVQTPLSTWEMPADQLRLTWRHGLLSTGYFVVFPWKDWPSTNKLHVVARLTLPEGRVLEASRDVSIRLTKNPPRRLDVPPPDADLPPPRPAEVEGPEIRNKPVAPMADWQRTVERPPVATLLLPEPVDVGRP
jgi:hypothetical protein